MTDKSINASRAQETAIIGLQPHDIALFYGGYYFPMDYHPRFWAETSYSDGINPTHSLETGI